MQYCRKCMFKNVYFYHNVILTKCNLSMGRWMGISIRLKLFMHFFRYLTPNLKHESQYMCIIIITYSHKECRVRMQFLFSFEKHTCRAEEYFRGSKNQWFIFFVQKVFSNANLTCSRCFSLLHNYKVSPTFIIFSQYTHLLIDFYSKQK